jgi:hypothetical protein
MSNNCILYMSETNQTYGGYPASLPPPASKRPNWKLIGIAGGLGCGLLVILGIAAIVGLVMHGVSIGAKEVRPAAEQFIHYVEQGQLDQAYSLTSSACRRVSSEAQFRKYCGMWRQQLGKPEALSFVNIFVASTTTAGTSYKMIYDERGSSCSNKLTLNLVSEQGHYRVQGFNFSPYLTPGQ